MRELEDLKFREPRTESERKEIGSASGSHCAGSRLSSWGPLQRQGPEKERRRGFDSLLVSLLRLHRLLHAHGCIYCLYATYTEVHSIYFRLTPFGCENNTKNPSFMVLLVYLRYMIADRSPCTTSHTEPAPWPAIFSRDSCRRNQRCDRGQVS